MNDIEMMSGFFSPGLRNSVFAWSTYSSFHMNVQVDRNNLTTEIAARPTAATKAGFGYSDLYRQKSWFNSPHGCAYRNNPKFAFPRSAFVPIAHLADSSGFIRNGAFRNVRNRDECATSLRRLTVLFDLRSWCSEHSLERVLESNHHLRRG